MGLPVIQLAQVAGLGMRGIGVDSPAVREAGGMGD